MNLRKANIENIKWSVVAPEVRFTCTRPTREVYEFRRANKSITQMIWITKQPVVDCANNLFNPKALIMLILN